MASAKQQAAEILIRRRAARKSLADFSRYIAPDEPPALHHRVLCDALDDVIEGRLRRLMVFMPPGSAKSSYASVRFPAYFLGRFPNKSIICGSYGEGLATSFGRKVRNIVDSKDYSFLFDTRLSEDSRAKGEWETRGGGSYFAAGVGSGITGRRADLGLIDDPVKGRKEADSELTREETWQWYKADYVSRLKPGSAQVVIQCMTGDTSVTMGDGSFKQLKDIEIGDDVATYDNGEISSSKVMNWKNQGSDSVFKIKTSSGIIVRANKRHPFLVERNGVLEWTRLENVAKGQKILRVIGGNGEESSAQLTDVKTLQSAEGTAIRIMRKQVGLLDIARTQTQTRLKEEAGILSIVTALLSKITTICLKSRMANALYAISFQERTFAPIGAGSCASTTATKQIRLGRFYAMIATLLSGTQKQKKQQWQLPNTSKFTLDEVVDITEDGREDVFDIQVERTENFIANGLVSHNTRWHEDDLSGRILPDDWNGESGDFEGFDGQMWKVICLPAQAGENDILGRKAGEWLWPEWFHEEFWLETKKIQTATDYRNWNSLYQQTPQPDSGTFFKREWFEPHRFKLGDEPSIYKYGASDYAVSDGKGDFTEHGIAGFDKIKDLWFVDWWSGQTTPDVWIEQQMNLRNKHSPYCWCAEVGVIRRAVEPYLKAAIRKNGSGLRVEWMPHIGDKAANARAFQAMAAQGRIHIPRTEWGDELLNQLVKFIPNTNFKDDKVDVCGLFGRILDSSFAPTDITVMPDIVLDPYGFDERALSGWKLQ